MISTDPSSNLDTAVRCLRQEIRDVLRSGASDALNLLRNPDEDSERETSSGGRGLAAIIAISKAIETGDGLLAMIRSESGKFTGSRPKTLDGMIKELDKENVIPGWAVHDLDWIRIHSNRRHGNEEKKVQANHRADEPVLSALHGAVAISKFLLVLEWFYCQSGYVPKLPSIYSADAHRPTSLEEVRNTLRALQDQLLNHQETPRPRHVEGLKERLTDHLDRLGETLTTRLENRKVREDAHFIPRRYRPIDAGPSEANHSIDLVSELKGRKGFTLFGLPASGKTISFYMLAKALLNRARARLQAPTDVPAPSELLPVLIEARDVVIEVRDRLRANPGCDVPALVYEFLRGAFVRPYGPPEELGALEDLRALFAESGTRPVVLFEAFDELITPDELKTPLTKIVVEQLERLDAHYDLAFAISSRFNQRDTLRPLRLKDLELWKLDDAVVADYVGRRWPSLPVSPREVAAIFRDNLDSRPLYLYILCDYFEKAGTGSRTPNNRMTLVRYWTDEVIGEHLVQLPWDHREGEENGGHQRRCLRQLARAFLPPSLGCSEAQIEEIVRQELGRAGRQERVAALVGCLKHFLCEDDKGFHFFHNAQREYFLVDVMRLYLTTGREEISQSLMLINQNPDLMELLGLLLQGFPDGWQDAARARLIKRLGPRLTDKTPPEPRTCRHEPAAALALLVRLFPHEDHTGLDASDRCFQGLLGADQNFVGINFTDSVLRGSDLRGAVLDDAQLVRANLDDVDLRGASLRGANLRGAVLQNAQLGRLEPQIPRPFRRDKQPTDLTWATLEDSDWFNIRIRHDGYFQLWTTRLLPDGQSFLISTTRGGIWFMSRDGADPIALPTNHIKEIPGHTNDILGFDYIEPGEVPPDDAAREEGWGWLATCSRDCSVRVFRVDLSARPPRLDPPGGLVLLKSTSEYFTRLRMGRGWLVVGDRAGQLYFIRLGEIARFIGPASDRGLEFEKITKHTEPVVCVEGPRGTPGQDEFYTAGYDGRVFVHHERPGHRSPEGAAEESQWRSRELVNLHDLPAQGASGKGNERTIRALTHWRPRPGKRGGFWIGDESGSLRYHDLATRETRLLHEQPGTPIFSIAVHPDGRQLAVGLSNGRVLFLDLEPEGGMRLALRDELTMACGDIVRSLLYLDGGDALLIVTWAGLVHTWSFSENRFTLAFDPIDRYWKPGDDRDHLLLGSADEVGNIRGLSPRYLRYLNLLGQP